MTIDKYGCHISWSATMVGKGSSIIPALEKSKSGEENLVDLEHARIININEPQNPKDASNKQYVDFRSQIKNQPNAVIDFDGKIIRNAGSPEDSADGVNLGFLMKHVPYMVGKSDRGYSCRGRRLTNVADPAHTTDAVTVNYMIQFIRDWEASRDASKKQQN